MICTFRCEILNTKHSNLYYNDYTIIYDSVEQYDTDSFNNFLLTKKTIQDNIERDILVRIIVVNEIDSNIIKI